MALYNKYRPDNLKKVCGQAHIKRILASQIKNKDFVHAYLFTGPAGTGKTTMARIMAAMLNCSTGMTDDPPADDPFVKAIMAGKHGTDVFEMDAASTRGIDDTKELRNVVFLPPMEMRYRVFIIDECHQLTREAWPVLLKVIEETPDHAIFIFCTTELNKVLETIQTRCQCFQFSSLSMDDIFGYIRNISNAENIQIDDDALRLVAVASRGSLRDALSKLEKVKQLSEGGRITGDAISSLVGVPSRKVIRKFMEGVLSQSLANSMESSSEALGCGVSPQDFFREMATMCYDLLILGRNGVDMGRLGYTQDDCNSLAELQKKIKGLVGNEYTVMLRHWITAIQACSQLTVLNLQPQAQINTAFIDMFIEFKRAKGLFEQNKSS
jgi:DNA polymerase-3 subunit gamma/tau